MPDYQLEQDDLAVADRLRLFGFVRRDDQMLYLWVLRAMNELRLEHVTQAHTDVVAAALADLSQRHPDAPALCPDLMAFLPIWLTRPAGTLGHR